MKNQTHGNGEYFFNENIFTGMIFEEWNNRIIYEFEVKNGIQDGPELSYDNNGFLESEREFLEGREHGFCCYYEQGILIEKVYFEQGAEMYSETYDHEGTLLERKDGEWDVQF